MPLTVTARAVEKHDYDVNSLLFHKGLLYSAADDGKIKVWDCNLKFKGQAEAHPCSAYCITASDDTLYSCSNEGTIKAWSLEDLKEKGTICKSDNEFWRVSYVDGVLYAGDDQGNIRTFVNDKLFGQVGLMEPVKDMLVVKNVVYTARDLDVVITEILSGGEKEHFSNKKNIMGRAPLALAGDKLCFTSREGKDIIVHENSMEQHYKEFSKVPAAHDMIINALAGTKNNNGTFLYSGGWDKILKQWKIENNGIKPGDTLTVDLIINCMTIGENCIYVAGGDGNIIRVDIN